MNKERIQKIFNATGLTVTVKELECEILTDVVAEIIVCGDDVLEGYNIDGVYLTKESRPEPSIVGDRYYDHWVVSHDVLIPGSHWEPDDYDYNEVGQFKSLYDAIAEVCRVLIQWKLDNYGECEAIEEMLNEPRPVL